MAPFVPTPSLGVSAALRLLAMSAQRGDVFVDLGCGDGRLVAAAYELASARACDSTWLRALALNRGCFAVLVDTCLATAHANAALH